ncbi:MAG: sensor domain-containing diguanylate cyclase [Lachnospiraceae bacterium]|nr:sensor domain-containing diguanylate cyclase [Lachnospiraceae bacterium]
MHKKPERTVTLTWILPLAILVIVISLLLLNFSTNSKKEANDYVETRITTVAEGYAEEVNQYLSTATAIQKASAAVLVSMDTHAKTVLNQTLEGLCAGDEFYLSAYCDPEGNATLNTGEVVTLSDTTYFANLPTDEPGYLYAADDGITGIPAIVCAYPLLEGEVTGHYLTFFDPTEITSIVSKTEFDAKAFYLLVDQQGQVAGEYGRNHGSSLIEKTNFWDSLQGSVIGSASLDNVKTRLRNGTEGIFQVKRNDESRFVYYVPIQIQDWFWVIGINESYVLAQERVEWKSSSDMIMQLFVVVFIFLGAIAVLNIITKIKANERNKELENKADTDLLTELNNKVATERKIKEYLESNPDKQSLLFVLDIDNFKKINDTMGHAFGDEVLRTLGHRLRTEFRVTDILGRTGGDEFMILLKDIPNQSVIEKEGKRVERFFRNFEAGGYVKYAATASIGAAVFPRDAKDFESLYKAADRALYVAKKRGKNQMAFFADSEVSRPVS